MEMSREAYRALPEFSVIHKVVSVQALESMVAAVLLLEGIDSFEACSIRGSFKQCIQDFEFCIHRSRDVQFHYAKD